MIKATDLKIEYLTGNPTIDIVSPKLLWKVQEAKTQTAYQVKASVDGQEIYDTGKVRSSVMDHKYQGKLKSRSQVTWKVRLWDEKDICGEWSEKSSFEIGLLDEKDWVAEWIDPELFHEPEERQPASYLKKKFLVENSGNARLYITAHGIYNAYINGKKASDFILAPGTSQYNARLQYQTYDVSGLLNVGKNEILVTVGDGWWRGDTGYGGVRNSFGIDLAILCQLEIDRKTVLISDKSWSASQEGPLGLNDLMQGECYDARKENICEWHPVTEKQFGYENLVCSNSFDVVEKENYTGKQIHTPNGEVVIDFGQNIAGYVKFGFYAQAGQCITLYHGECLDQNGNFTQENFQAPEHRVEQCVKYICKEGWNEYKPEKSIFGFRYIKAITDVKVTEKNFTAIAVYSDMPQTGKFECGHPGINQLFSNAVWSMKGNFLEIPTDCPTRERTGFTGDAQVFVNTGMYLMECYPVYRKFLSELREVQLEGGCISQTAPASQGHLFDGAAGWSDAIDLIPWRMYLRYNNPEILAENYEKVKEWLAYCLERAKKDNPGRKKGKNEKYSSYLLDTGWHWGEWIEPDWNGFINTEDPGGTYLRDIYEHGAPEVCTSHLSYGCYIASEMAKALGYQKEAEFYSEMRKFTKLAYREVCMENGHMKQKRQCDYVHAIMFDMLSEEEKKIACDELNEMIVKNGFHLNTGFLSTYELLHVLTDYGHGDTAWKLMLQDTYPGWLYQLKYDATTVWENWKGMEAGREPKDSMNHYSFGTFAGWLMDRVAGIRVEKGKIRIQPYPDRQIGYVKASYDSPFGKIKSSWEYEGENCRIKVEIPANAHAEILLPDGSCHEADYGKYEYVIMENKHE